LVAATIESLRPAYVLVEGPADMNDRLDELLLGHELPIAVFTYHRDGDQSRASWSPFCEYSPEWVALTEAQRHGAEVRFIDLPAWHPALADLQNRYADAERRYTEVLERLCRMLSLDNVDTLWDHLVEADPDSRLDKRLASYFELVRGNVLAGPADAAREAYMARWVRAAAVRAAGRPVVVVCGGFHAPALARLAVEPDDSPPGWPELPPPPAGATGGSYLVPPRSGGWTRSTATSRGCPRRSTTNGCGNAGRSTLPPVCCRRSSPGCAGVSSRCRPLTWWPPERWPAACRGCVATGTLSAPTYWTRWYRRWSGRR
jgi:hypothetical protein